MEKTEKRHYAVINPYNRNLTLTFEGKTIAETQNAMILKEVGKTVYDPVFISLKKILW
jgi:uncharacterized protein (DUF427 family)